MNSIEHLLVSGLIVLLLLSSYALISGAILLGEFLALVGFAGFSFVLNEVL